MAAIQSSNNRNALLRNSLRGNAAFSGLSGAALIAGAGPLGSVLGVHPAISMPLGAGLIVFALTLAKISSPERLRADTGVLVAVLDLAWVAASVALLLVGGLGLTTIGMIAVGLVAEVIGTLAVLQMFGARKITST